MSRITAKDFIAAFRQAGAVPVQGRLFEWSGGSSPPRCCGMGALIAATDPGRFAERPATTSTASCEWISRIIGAGNPVHVAGFIHGWDQVGLRNLPREWRYHPHYGTGMDDGLIAWTACRAAFPEPKEDTA